jgi:amino acid transporter
LTYGKISLCQFGSISARTGLIYQTSTSRIGYGLARNRYYPRAFQQTDARGVPWISLIFSFLFGIVFLLPFRAGSPWSGW